MATNDNKLIKPAKELLGKEVAAAGSDSVWFNKLMAMPNPDPILRRIGVADAVYASIMADAHVIGDIRSIRGSFHSYRTRVVAGDEDDPRSQAAADLCEYWMQYVKPNAVATDWLEVMWQMSACIFTGYKIHEVVWNTVQAKGGSYVLPTRVLDRPNSRFKFDADGQLLLLSRDSVEGLRFPDYQFVVSRHMATCTNPYGVALLSSCYWPWLFKTGGFKYFMQYCEKYAVPVPFGQYPQGAQEKDIEQFEQSLADFLNNFYVLAPDGSKIELLTPSGGGNQLPQEALIVRCNNEMSKALTGQAVVAELQQVGARAASENAASRQEMINNSDRDISSSGMSEIFRWITVFNFGENVAPPKLEFFTEKQAGKERADAYQAVANMGGRPSRKALLEEMNMPEAEDDADAILPAQSPVNAAQTPQNQPLNTDQTAFNAQFNETSAADSEGDQRTIAQARADLAFENAVVEAVDAQFSADVIEPFAVMLEEFEASGKTLAEFHESLGAFLAGVDDGAVRELTEQALTLSALRGAADAQANIDAVKAVDDAEQ